MILYYTGLVSTSPSPSNIIDMSNPKYRKTVRLENKDGIQEWASQGGCKDGYIIQFIENRYYLGMFSDRDYFAYVIQWE